MVDAKHISAVKQLKLLLSIAALCAVGIAAYWSPELLGDDHASEINHGSIRAKTAHLSEDYVTEIGPAERSYDPLTPGVVEYCPLDRLTRPGCAFADLTLSQRRFAQEEGRLPIQVDPPGWQGNREVAILALESVEGSRDYRGWFWNRSHLIADSLGGSAGPENLISGTRMQNVGSTQTGGMSYTETIARSWLDSQTDDSCPLYYAATPQYIGDELVPRSVKVDMRSCDGTIDIGLTVLNIANGYAIDYSTGEFTVDQ
ncbi:DNA/RNA non-specific endonuclease [Leucobacter sp. UCMA 4100]|uniref:DNA/RNA non-specific endonuclease n=1 Tax=Leucobacter sp. UCMA 4100 TaxID=2810534 RepID=UPI0022EB2F34|nr:DNA/RNA non-specific endonuclease [Leucobacter sp. UCMA 4100]MDA3146519.1 DNA/RNA non-specific endonuclease [Leucobacter sp. UCMA 4100]